MTNHDATVQPSRAAWLNSSSSVELIEGLLVAMSPKGPEHDAAVEWLTERFVTELAGAQACG